MHLQEGLKALPIQRKIIFFHIFYVPSIHLQPKPGIFLAFLPHKHPPRSPLPSPSLPSFFSLGNLSNATISSKFLNDLFPKGKSRTHLSTAQASGSSLSSLHISHPSGSNTHLLVIQEAPEHYLWSCGSLLSFLL